MATREEIDKVIESTDMVDLVSPYVKLTKQGKSLKGLCPFHNEKTPSFVVSQEKHLAHCFGCGKGGNPIQFLMDIKQISFAEALDELAKKNGIKIDVKLNNANKQDYSKYYQIFEIVQKVYNQNLTLTKSGKEALKYLYKRGLDDETIKMFQIGLAPNEIDSVYKILKEANYLELDMIDLGIVNSSEKGYYDLFTRRIMFPIADEFGHIIGYSGRLFNNDDPNQPKYVNTKETFLFKKGQVLFNLHNAKTEMLRKKRVILHEGQMDVIAAYRAGLKEAVCTMGTALTIDHARTLKKYTDNVIICFDGDKAGINASKKAINILKQLNMKVHLVLLPNGTDPDDYVCNNGSDAYVNYFENNILDELEYLFEVAFLNKNLNDSIVIEEIKTEAFNLIYNMPGEVLKDKYLKILSTRLNANLDSIIIDYNSYCKPLTNNYPVENYSDEEIFDNNFFDDLLDVKPKPKFNNIFEIRLLLYARSSKEKALSIDERISEYFNAFSPVNRNIWIKLINEYYTNNELFDDKKFISLLSPDEQQVYLDNIELARNSIDPYNDADLALLINKMSTKEFKERNKIIDKQIKNLSDEQKVLKINEKFKNKKKTMPKGRNK